MRFRILASCLLLPLALWIALPLVSDAADPQRELERVEADIDEKKRRLGSVGARARVLTSDVTALTGRVDALQGTIDGLQRRQDTLQGELDAKRRELGETQGELRDVRARAVRLRTRLTSARQVLAARLVELYKSGEPDVISVVLDADGFGDMLANGAYLQRIGEQDRRIITAVRAAKGAATTTVGRLRTLEARQRRIADEIYVKRNAVARTRIDVESRRDEIDRARAAKRRVLRQVRATATDLHEDVGRLEAEQAKIERRIRAAQTQNATGGIAPGAIRRGGRFIWPLDGPITSPFGWRTSPVTRFHQGLDIGMPDGTPIRAAGAGTVIIAGVNGGYGNFTCLDHGGGLSSCYAHQSSIGVSIGQRVAQGDVIGAVGNTGFSFGAHLHFEVRVNGSAVDPLSYL
ncbi:peptidoglycan DD-metalloendopeptidase family protein [Conexibacter sp. JD483]|uniref:murein hydrolase activator EnvC family protein n=1 Tax=unclassified Conexibacter TaxID=2627773 RepID=UPI0027196540|nr:MULTISPECIES: peptidoglycan DD-metalloendopeptidase family protein [unclassified Conexibacter]MDO8188128.1 peptidoglycan DD-metalloendopeptidase family protein [Conexibacter sp. CPCC 205706]MDO8201308.1 peptidoglycan DD-metalloendopeptidase family protein [Conexibacter sp. CPCC 205762]MDR9370421.1 peptidoglycan DD-metalloendopeptidase family protein [Conexibacter sp. JD483]